MSNALSCDVYADDRLLDVMDAVVLTQKRPLTLRLIPLVNRNKILDLTSSIEIKFLVRDAADAVVITKIRPEITVDDPSLGSLRVPLLTTDTLLPVGIYNFVLYARWNGGREYEWQFLDRMRVQSTLLS